MRPAWASFFSAGFGRSFMKPASSRPLRASAGHRGLDAVVLPAAAGDFQRAHPVAQFDATRQRPIALQAEQERSPESIARLMRARTLAQEIQVTPNGTASVTLEVRGIE
jgi:hypothetical protein